MVNGMTALTLKLPPRLTEVQFYRICRANPELRLERTASGELVIMSPTGTETGARNSSLTAQLWFWNERTGLGQVFDSSAGFRLPDGATRSPDASWVSQQRWQQLSAEEKKRFALLCPDFVAELRSPGDSLADLQSKMKEYMTNGTCLGWLLDTVRRRVEIYRPGQEVEIVDNPDSLSGEEVLPDFKLDLSRILY